MYRQGDILLKKVANIPSDAEVEETLTIATGEVTGHRHRIATKKKDDARLWVAPEGRFLEVRAPMVDLMHEEHHPIMVVGPATYLIVQQREYTPEEIQFVVD